MTQLLFWILVYCAAGVGIAIHMRLVGLPDLGRHAWDRGWVGRKPLSYWEYVLLMWLWPFVAIYALVVGLGLGMLGLKVILRPCGKFMSRKI